MLKYELFYNNSELPGIMENCNDRTMGLKNRVLKGVKIIIY